jgi:7-carboxy-7-deazaguanine synthase
VNSILRWLADYPDILVEVTGGEPLLQANVYLLMQQLLADNRTVLLETNGSVPIDRVPQAVHIIMDIKCPGSGMDDKLVTVNLHHLTRRLQTGCRDNVKFVLSSEEDFHWCVQVLQEYGPDTLPPVLLSPVTNRFSPTDLATLLLAHPIAARLQLQLHTLLWPQQQRGV